MNRSITTPRNLAQALRRGRLVSAVSQTILADRAGVTREALAALEAEGAGSVETLLQVVGALGGSIRISEISVPDVGQAETLVHSHSRTATGAGSGQRVDVI